jgi:hypothetical protein
MIEDRALKEGARMAETRIAEASSIDMSGSAVILTPKHPSYPAGHGAITAAGVAVLRAFFPQDESEYDGMVEEVNNARVWAGMHFRGDMTAGNQVGDRVAAAILLAIHLDGSPGENPYRSVARNLSDNSGGPYYNPFYHRK